MIKQNGDPTSIRRQNAIEISRIPAHLPYVVTSIKAKMLRIGEAEDIGQETALAAIRYLRARPDVVIEGDIRNWLMRIASRKVVDATRSRHGRGSRRRPIQTAFAFEQEFDSCDHRATDGDGNLSRSDWIEFLRARAGERVTNVVELLDAGYSPSEVATILMMSVRSVQRATAVARKVIRTLL